MEGGSDTATFTVKVYDCSFESETYATAVSGSNSRYILKGQSDTENFTKTKLSGTGIEQNCYLLTLGLDYFKCIAPGCGDCSTATWTTVTDASSATWISAFTTAASATDFSYTATFSMTLDSEAGTYCLRNRAVNKDNGVRVSLHSYLNLYTAILNPVLSSQITPLAESIPKYIFAKQMVASSLFVNAD